MYFPNSHIPKILANFHRKMDLKNNYCYVIGIIAILLIAGLTYRAYTQASSKIDFNSAVGKQAPDFSLSDINGKTVTLSDYKGKNVVLFFNEGAMCYPSCWNQIAQLAEDSRFNNEDTVAFSIVVDTKDEWKRIMSQMPALSKASILFDTSKEVSTKYGVLAVPSSMHMGMMPGHTYIVVDKQGIIGYVFDDPSMGIRNDQIASEIEKLG